jgi:transposase
MRILFVKKLARTARKNIVYVDESGIDKHLIRERCRAKRGRKVYGATYGRKFERCNIVAGKICARVVAPMEYKGTTDHILFEQWFAECLLPEVGAGKVIVMDNASFHRPNALNALAKAAGCRILFLPPYSPDLNPIEKEWANLKKFLRNYGKNFSSLFDALQDYFKVE